MGRSISDNSLLTPLQTIATQAAIKTVTVTGSLDTALPGNVPMTPSLTLSNNRFVTVGGPSWPTLNFTATAFSYPAAAQTIQSIQLQIATDSGFANVVSTSSIGTSVTFTLTSSTYSSFLTNIPSTYTEITPIYFRIRYFNTNGYASAWSNSQGLTLVGTLITDLTGLAPTTPTLTISPSTTTIYNSASPTYSDIILTGNSFAYSGSVVQTMNGVELQYSASATFASGNISKYYIGTAVTNTLLASIYSSLIVLPAELTSSPVLYLRIRYYNTNGYASSWSTTQSLTIVNLNGVTAAKFSGATAAQRTILGTSTAGSSGSGTTWSDYTGKALIAVIGGGGAGSCDDFTLGAGGGGSGYLTIGVVDVTPSMSYTYVTGNRGYDAGDAGTGPYSAFNASTATAPGSSSITINGVTISAAAGQQAFLRTSTQTGGNGGSGGGGYGDNANGGTGGSNGAGTLPGTGSGTNSMFGTGGSGGTTDDGGKYATGGGGAGFCIDFSGQIGGAMYGGNRTSGRGSGIGAGGGGKGRDQGYSTSQMRPFAGGIVLLKKYW